MKFDSNRAWQDAMAAVSANRQVLLPVAGVFFLLPTLLSAVFLGDVQGQLLGAMGRPDEVERIFGAHAAAVLGFGLGGALVQGIGYLAIMALLGDRGRLTVGEAITVAFRALPTLIGAALLSIVGMILGAMLLGAMLGGLIALVAGVSVASAVAGVAVIVVMTYASVKLALVVPVVIAEGVSNPVAALVRSWRLTRGNSLRLFGFFTLLMIGYLAIALVITLVVVGPMALLVGQGQGLTLFSGVVSGVIGALASVILTAVLAMIHRQLAGPSPERESETFR